MSDRPLFARAALTQGTELAEGAPKPIQRTIAPDGSATIFSVDQPVISTTILARVVGVDATFLKWRRKYHLFQWSADEARKGIIVLFSTYDALRARLMVVMVEHGVHVIDAARIVGGLDAEQPASVAAIKALFNAIVGDPRYPSLVAFHRGGIAQFPGNRATLHTLNPAWPIGDALRWVQHQRVDGDKLGGLSMVNLRDVIAHVQSKLCVDIITSDATLIDGGSTMQ